jgi:hypothetical protein
MLAKKRGCAVVWSFKIYLKKDERIQDTLITYHCSNRGIRGDQTALAATQIVLLNGVKCKETHTRTHTHTHIQTLAHTNTHIHIHTC